MYLNDVLKQEECRNEALQELRKLNIKCRPKKPKQHNVKSEYKCFKVPLGVLPTETVTLKTGQQITVPKLVHQLCSFILTKVSTEGIFRKEGSRARQGEMKLILNGGGVLGRNLHVVDIAALLKTFLRELLDPLIPTAYHELFLRCIILEPKSKLHALSLACLLLPLEHLNTLTYLMQFLNEVSQHSKKNRMDSYNLAVVIAPTVIPIEEKLNSQTVQIRTTKICEIVRVLIENSFEVGIIPEIIIERLGSNASSEVKKKKRRSGSLTRMFNGLKKIVGGKSGEENNIVTPDLLLTPINTNAMKKRRTSNGVSHKRKKEQLNKFPESALLNTPFTPCRTPISMDLSGATDHALKDTIQCHKEKKALWFSRSKSVKNLAESDSQFKHPIHKVINRRWSVITNPSGTKKAKKRNSFTMVPQPLNVEPDYIRVSKVEYEDIKNRVSAMEKRISIELDTVQSQIKTDNENNTNIEVNVLNDVQTVYQQTLESNQLSPTTDQLAKRLSRELKIRRSAEQKIIRSPSARKIGSMRKKSLERNGVKVTRHQSWHLGVRDSSQRASLKRGKPNTVLTGLPVQEAKEMLKDVTCNVSGSSTDTWTSADGFFDTLSLTRSENDIINDKSTNRASIAKLRCQNAGMVLAKAKLFDQLKDSSDSSNGSLNKNLVRVGTKIGSNRKIDNRLSYRVRSLKYEDRKLGRKSMSPRRRNGQLSQKAKLHIAKQYMVDSRSEKENIIPIKDSDRINNFTAMSPKCMTPHIKKTLNIKTPKRLIRTPVIERSTPLRALKTPGQHIV